MTDGVAKKLIPYFIIIKMNYEETLQYLQNQLPMFQQVGASAMKVGLGNIIELTDYLDTPQANYQTIHIAGTNGKGSTAHILAGILQAQGLKVGLFTSPHYRDFRERIKINGQYITEKAVVEFVEKHRNELEKICPSYFEMTVALAFDHFKNEQVDIAIIETGLGGKDDSTNIIQPILSIITNISLEHTHILGDTLAEIALAKAGIIKFKTPIIIGEEQTETAPIFIKKAKEQEAPITFATKKIQIQAVRGDYKSSIVNVFDHDKHLLLPELEAQLFGNYQIKNLKTALVAVQVLNEKCGFQITKKAIYKGTKQIKSLTNMIGRWDVLGEKPLILADSGHNFAGIQYVVEQLSTINYQKLHIVFGMVGDKDIQKILAILPKTAQYYFTKPSITRALNEQNLAKQARFFSLEGNIFLTVNQALNAAKANAQSNDLVFVGGSSYVVAEVIGLK